MKAQKFKLILLSFLQFAVWGAYLTSQGRYLAEAGFGSRIGWFYSVQGIVSIFMPAIMGIIADKWIQAQRLLGLCHTVAGTAMIGAGIYGVSAGADVEFGVLFGLYTLSIAFFMPTIAISNSVSYTVLEKSGLDPVKDFPPIRVWGTVGFICSMWFVDLVKVGGAAMQETSMQYVVSGALSIILALYTLTLPECPVNRAAQKKSLVDAMGLRAFTLFRQRKMAVFFIFSMLLGVALQITNGFANPFLADFGNLSEYQGTFGVEHSNMLISLSQISETLCILLIPFFLKRYGIKNVMLIAMLAWTLRFGFFALGNPGSGVWLIILSMLVYGVAFDFFNQHLGLALCQPDYGQLNPLQCSGTFHADDQRCGSCSRHHRGAGCGQCSGEFAQDSRYGRSYRLVRCDDRLESCLVAIRRLCTACRDTFRLDVQA